MSHRVNDNHLGPRNLGPRNVPTMTIRISLEPVDDLAALEREWRTLEACADATYYHSWGWVGTWVRHVHGRAPLTKLIARDDSRVVGLALAAESVRGARGRTLYLQGTRGKLGRITSERGGFLVHRDVDAAVRAAYFEFLGGGVAAGRWGKAVLGWVRPATVDEAAFAESVPVLRWREPNYLVELDRVRESGEYITLLGDKTRKNMRRSRRAYERRGPLRLRIAGDVAEAQTFLTRLVALHEATWRARGWPGNFADPVVLAFHRDLVRERTESREVQLARITAGSEEVGYLYSLVYRNRVIGYDMGLRYDPDRDTQPGRMCDWLAVEHYAEQGYDVYDNLSGETQFKRSLGTRTDELAWLLIRRDGLVDRVGERARHAFIAKVRDTAVHRWQRRFRIAVATKLDALR